MWLGRIQSTLLFSTTFHPQTDVQTKVVNKSRSTLLQVFIKENKKSGDEHLPHIEFSNPRIWAPNLENNTCLQDNASTTIFVLRFLYLITH